MKLHNHRDDCRLCHSTSVEKVLPLRPIPVHTPNVGLEPDSAEADQVARTTAPLDLYRCGECGHLQLLDIVDPELQYRSFRYRTSISHGLPEHFRQMARELFDTLGLEPGAQALEIGSNDGTLLAALHECGAEVLGVDPAREIAEAALRRGVPTLARFFNASCADDIRSEHGAFDVVIANNTLANLDDLEDVAAGVRRLLGPSGVFVVETADGGTVIEDRLLDTIYHEHLSYFLVKPFQRWLATQGLELFRVERQSTKGGSLRFFAQPLGGPRSIDDSVQAALAAEEQRGLDQLETYQRFIQEIGSIQSELAGLIRAHQDAGGCVAGYGASVGSVTLLEQFDLWNDLDFLLDDEPLAETIRGPRGDLSILSGDDIDFLNPSLIVVLAHRYADVIQEKRASYLQAGGALAVPLPSLRIIERKRTAA